jgi:Spy/CpxP family protein refolding chaperone
MHATTSTPVGRRFAAVLAAAAVAATLFAGAWASSRQDGGITAQQGEHGSVLAGPLRGRRWLF